MDEAVAISEAKTHFSRMIAEVEGGKEVVIRRGPHKVARIIPFKEQASGVLFGLMQGEVRVGEDFDDPMLDFEPYT